MSAEESRVDFGGSGLLDGLDGRDREAREDLLQGLLERGVTLEELKAAVAEDRLVLLPVERVLGGRFTAAEVAEQTGVPADQLRRVWRALGFAPPHHDERTFTEEDVRRPSP
jgi:adenylate cyclase